MTSWFKHCDHSEGQTGTNTACSRRQPSLKARAVQYLARREYCRSELREKLIRSLPEGHDEAQIDELLDELEAKNYLSDERYARSRARTRGAKFGNARIKMELQRQGLDSETIRDALQPLENEQERAMNLWIKRFKGQKPKDFKEKSKQIRFLANRGFSFDVIQKVIQSDLQELSDFD